MARILKFILLSPIILASLSSEEVKLPREGEAKEQFIYPNNFSSGLGINFADPDDPLLPEELIPNWCENIHLEGSILYWKVNSSDWDYVAIKESTSNRTKQRVKNLSIDFAPGFRLGIDMRRPFSNGPWSFFWTHQDCRESNSVQISPKAGKTVAFSLPSIDNFSEILSAGQVAVVRGRIKWRYEVFDLELGDWLNFSHNLCMRPFLGIRLADIHENLKDKVVTAPDLDIAFLRVRIKCEHKGLGPRGGLDFHYPLGFNFGIFGGIAGSLVWGGIENRTKTTIAPFGEGVAKGSIRENIQLLRPMLDLKLGFTSCFKACNCLPVTLSVAWESHCLFNQFRYFATELPGSTSFIRSWKTSSNVVTQGFTFTAAIDW